MIALLISTLVAIDSYSGNDISPHRAWSFSGRNVALMAKHFPRSSSIHCHLQDCGHVARLSSLTHAVPVMSCLVLGPGQGLEVINIHTPPHFTIVVELVP